tara:strand:+ start:7008 stop:7250 length:243 start_codon:yes stop_codon:yes gene_type:complete
MLNKKQISSRSWGYLQIRIFEYLNKKETYDLVFTSTAWPYWRLTYKNLDILTAKELYNVYKLRAWFLRFLPPKVTHWLMT